MSLPLLHNPSRIIQKVLISLGLGSASATSSWPVFYSNEPSQPDNCITVYDTAGRHDGRAMTDGETWLHQGFMVRVRSKDNTTGWQKSEMIRKSLGEDIYALTVIIDSIYYVVQCVAQIGQTIPLGKDPDSNRSLFTINALISVKRVEPGTGT